jgi:hypothetical protein
MMNYMGLLSKVKTIYVSDETTKTKAMCHRRCDPFLLSKAAKHPARARLLAVVISVYE